MIAVDRAAQLEQSFHRTINLLEQLLTGMQQRRASWASAVPSTIAPSAELEQVSRALAIEELSRGELLAKVLTDLPAVPHVDKADLHVNISRICQALPTRSALELRRAADTATRLAKQVRIEVALGERLLRFSQRAHEDMLTSLTGGKQQEGLPSGYDRNARSRAGLGLGAAGAGNLVDGRI